MGDWIRESNPDPAAELGPIPARQCLDILIRETGLSIDPDSGFDDGCKPFLEALKSKHAPTA